MKFSWIVFFALFISVIIIVFFFLSYFPSIFMGERIPKFEEMINFTISYNISANFETEIKIGAGKAYFILTENCSLLYLTNNISVLKCENIYVKKEKNSTISCEKYGNEWNCERSSETFISYIVDISYILSYIYDPKRFLGEILSNLNYTVVRNWTEKMNGKFVYCYNITYNAYSIIPIYDVKGSVRSNEENYKITGNITICFDRQTRFPMRIEIKAESDLIFYHYKYEVKSLVVNPRYEAYSNMLNLPSKVKLYVKKLYVGVYNNSLTIPLDAINDLEISEEVEEVTLSNFSNSYTIRNCIKKENYITCSINETIEEFIRKYMPEIKINTQNYMIVSYNAKYIFGKIGRLIKIEGSSRDLIFRNLIICYDKDWNVSKQACQGYKYMWGGDYTEYVVSSFSEILLINDTVKKIVIVVNSPENYPWTINVYEKDRLIKTCYNVTVKTPCIVYLS